MLSNGERQTLSVVKNVMLLGADSSVLRTDRKCLRTALEDITHEVTILSSGREALKHSLEQPIDLIICDERLSDMKGREALRLLRLHPALRETPMLLLSTDNRRASVLSALSAGCTSYVLRPYSLDWFQRRLSQALSGELESIAPLQRQEPSLQAFLLELSRLESEEDAPPDPVEEALRQGVMALREKNGEQARNWFQQALELDPKQADAHQGLAHSWVLGGHPALAKEHFRRAIRMNVEQGRYAKARAVHEELRRRDPKAEDPIRDVLATMLRGGELDNAVKLLSDLHKNGGIGPETATLVARNCFFSNRPMETARELCRKLDAADARPAADSLRQRLLDDSRKTELVPPEVVEEAEEYGEAKGPLSNLRAILAVARYTIQTYRRNTLPEQA